MGDLTDIRDRITRLTLAAGLPNAVWRELCKIDSDLRAAEPIWSLAEMTSQRNALLRQLIEAKQKVRAVVRSAVVEVCWPNDDDGSRARTADAIADRAAAQLTEPRA
jgi:hypothetical protein